MINPKAYVASTSQAASQDVEKVAETSSDNEEQVESEDGEDMEYESVSNDDDSQ